MPGLRSSNTDPIREGGAKPPAGDTRGSGLLPRDAWGTAGTGVTPDTGAGPQGWLATIAARISTVTSTLAALLTTIAARLLSSAALSAAEHLKQIDTDTDNLATINTALYDSTAGTRLANWAKLAADRLLDSVGTTAAERLKQIDTDTDNLAGIKTGTDHLAAMDTATAAIKTDADHLPTMDTTLTSIKTGTDHLAAIDTALGTGGTLHTDLNTTLAGKLDTLHTDLNTTLHADLATTLGGKLDTLNTDLGTGGSIYGQLHNTTSGHSVAQQLRQDDASLTELAKLVAASATSGNVSLAADAAAVSGAARLFSIALTEAVDQTVTLTDGNGGATKYKITTTRAVGDIFNFEGGMLFTTSVYVSHGTATVGKAVFNVSQ